jgi:hypothetical protein
MAQFKFKTPASNTVVDEETGIEICDPNEATRVRDFVMTGDHGVRRTLTLSLHDPSHEAGSIEFPVETLTRTAQETWSSGKTVTYDVWYGYRINSREFESRFRKYTYGDPKRVEHLRAFVRDALLFQLQNTEGAVVQFV